jgi:hypothetical protein
VEVVQLVQLIFTARIRSPQLVAFELEREAVLRGDKE